MVLHGERLLSFRDIVERFQRGEDLFDITIEKWKRIKRSLSEAASDELQPILDNARMGGPFCLEYNQQCNLCPIHKWCRDPNGRYQNIMRSLYMFATSGDYYFKQQALKEIEQFLDEMEDHKWAVKQRLN